MEKVKNQEELEIDLQKLLFACLKKWWLILLCAVVAGGVVLLYTINFITPIYRASFTMYVSNTRSDDYVDYVTTSNLSASQQLVTTYAAVMQSDMVLSKVAEQADVDYTLDELKEFLSTSQVNSTEILAVYISHPDPEMAAYLANVMADVVPQVLEDFVEGSSAKVMDYPKVPDHRYSPSYSKNGLLGALVGCFVAVAYIVLRSLLDDRVKGAEDLESVSDLPVLGQIPSFESIGSKKKSAYEYVAGSR